MAISQCTAFMNWPCEKTTTERALKARQPRQRRAHPADQPRIALRAGTVDAVGIGERPVILHPRTALHRGGVLAAGESERGEFLHRPDLERHIGEARGGRRGAVAGAGIGRGDDEVRRGSLIVPIASERGSISLLEHDPCRKTGPIPACAGTCFCGSCCANPRAMASACSRPSAVSGMPRGSAVTPPALATLSPWRMKRTARVMGGASRGGMATGWVRKSIRQRKSRSRCSTTSALGLEGWRQRYTSPTGREPALAKAGVGMRSIPGEGLCLTDSPQPLAQPSPMGEGHAVLLELAYASPPPFAAMSAFNAS